MSAAAALTQFGNRLRSATRAIQRKLTDNEDDESEQPENQSRPAGGHPPPYAAAASPGPIGKVFKNRISPNATEIPPIVKKCIEYIEKAGTNIQGIFRLSGSHDELQLLVSRFDNGEDVDVTKHDPLVVAALLKKYLRDMPEPLTTFEWYDPLLASVGISDPNTQLKEIKRVINYLPYGNKLLLSYLLGFLNRFLAYEKVTLMSSQNLAIVFAPNILRAENLPIETEIQDSVFTNALVMLLIERYNELFADFLVEQKKREADASTAAASAPAPAPESTSSLHKRELSGGKAAPPLPPKPANSGGLARAASAGSLKVQGQAPPLHLKPRSPTIANRPASTQSVNSVREKAGTFAPNRPTSPVNQGPAPGYMRPSSPESTNADASSPMKTSPSGVKRPAPMRSVVPPNISQQSRVSELTRSSDATVPEPANRPNKQPPADLLARALALQQQQHQPQPAAASAPAAASLHTRSISDGPGKALRPLPTPAGFAKSNEALPPSRFRQGARHTYAGPSPFADPNFVQEQEALDRAAGASKPAAVQPKFSPSNPFL